MNRPTEVPASPSASPAARLAIRGGEPLRTKPFPNWPVFDESEEQAVLSVLRSGRWWGVSFGEGPHTNAPAGEGPDHKVTEFQTAFARMQGVPYAIACASGTAALEVGLKALGVGPGDEVIVPPYTFVATATAPLMVNAVPIFADIDPQTLNLDPRRVREAITPRTRAVIPVHFAGLAADMEAILAVARDRGLTVLEDAAHAHGGKWNDCGLGSLGQAGTFSFQASKNMTAGEGGLIVTGDAELARKCESLVWGGRELGRAWYEHFRLGWNYRLTEFQAAILIEQLKRLPAQNVRRMENARYLNRRLAEIPGIHPMRVPEYATVHPYHIYAFRFREEEFGAPRDRFLEAFAAEGIPCSGGYAFPLYRNEMFVNRDFYPRGCPLTCGHYSGTVDYRDFEALCPVAEQVCRDAVWLEHRVLL